MRLLTVIFHSKIFSKCDSFGEFLSYMEHVMMETPELLNRFEESETETWHDQGLCSTRMSREMLQNT